MTERTIRIDGDAAAAEAVRAARELALAAGLSATDAAHVATAVSEIAVNQVRHAGGGTVRLRAGADGVLVDAEDDGPGIPDLERAMTDGYSTAGSLGLGLPGARRLMDEFEITSPGSGGVRVRMARWARQGRAQSPEGLADHGVHEGRLACLIEEWPAGLLLALVPHGSAAAVRAEPAAPPHALVERAGGGDAAVASFSGLDGRLAWRATPGTSAVLLRGRGERLAVVGTAPHLRAHTLPVLRGDLLVLASFPLGDLAATLPREPGKMASQVAAGAPAGTPGPAVLVAGFRRGSRERRSSAHRTSW